MRGVLTFGLALALINPLAGQAPATRPEKVDLAPEFLKLGMAPWQQRERNVCSLFAITALAEFELARHEPDGHRPLSQEYLIWAANRATGRTGDQAMFYEAVHGLNSLGICSRDRAPFSTVAENDLKPDDAVVAEAREGAGRWRVEWIRRWNLERPMTEKELLAIKETLAAGHPVACGLRWPKKAGHELLEVPPPGDVYDGHSIVFTGYEDTPGQHGGGVFLFRNSWGENWGSRGHGKISYAYAKAYANDAVWLRPGRLGSEVPLERFEAEDIVAKGKTNTTPQEMRGWGGPMWSGEKHLFCGTKDGDSVDLRFPVRKAGRYRVRLLGTAAPDFGIVRVTLDGQPVPGEFDLYCGRVSPAGSLELGTHSLKAGDHRLRVTVSGKNDASGGYSIGLDTIDLLPPEETAVR